MPFVIFVTLAGVMSAAGCARYARTVDTLYDPVSTVRGGSGQVFIVIPASRHTQSPDVKWVLGTVKNNGNEQIDEVLSPRSPAEIIQTAFGLELKKAGYTAIPATKRPDEGNWVLDLAKTEIELDQNTAFADIKVKCRVRVGVDVYRDGEMVQQLRYGADSMKTDVKNRDELATDALQEALHSVMLQAVPDLVGLFKR